MKPGNLIFTGAIAGLIIGLIITWGVVPVEYFDTYPPMMAQQYQEDWVEMVAIVYGVEGNWERTQVRLLELDNTRIQHVLVGVIEGSLNEAYPLDVLQRLAELGKYYNIDSPAVDVLLQQSPGAPPTRQSPPTLTPTASVRPTSTPAPPTATPLPALTATPPLSPLEAPETLRPFTIISQTLDCAPVPAVAISLELSQTVKIRGRDVIEQIPVPGREIWLIWETGADRAITGFKPDYGLGYADFDIEPGWTYNIYIDSPTGIPLLTIQAEPCMLGGVHANSWTTRLLMVQEEPIEDANGASTPDTPD